MGLVKRNIKFLQLFILLFVGACGFVSHVPDQRIPRLHPATPGYLIGNCDNLATKLLHLEGLSIEALSTIPTGGVTFQGRAISEHCLLRAKVYERTSPVDQQTYAISFEMRLPKAWNGRFWYQGNGGLDGNVVPALGILSGESALEQGFVVLSSDAGHNAAQNPFFGLDPQARLDYGYQAVGKLVPLAREIIKVAYGRYPDRSYIGGCSNGGRHALVAASRYSQLFDGFVAGAPGLDLPLAALANIWGAQKYATIATGDPRTPTGLGTAFTEQERATIAQALLDRCDMLDGLKDGLVFDTHRCQVLFDLSRDIPTCVTSRDGNCLTQDQKEVLKEIFSGAKRGSGESFYAPFPFDTGITSQGFAFWEFTAPLVLDSGAVAFVFQTPPASPIGFNGPEFALTADVDRLLDSFYASVPPYNEASMDFMNPLDRYNLDHLRNRGAKLLLYHGVSDPIFSVNHTISWYSTLAEKYGGFEQVTSFARLFTVPGMGHCSGGPSTDLFEPISAIVNWVEYGVAPEFLVARTRPANLELPPTWSPSRSRILCPYPKIAIYAGGDPETYNSFRCINNPAIQPTGGGEEW